MTLNSHSLPYWTVTGLASIMLWCFATASAEGAVCDLRNGQLICLDRIQRSAKNYWEYRVRLTVNGVAQPIVWYDCRQRKKSQTAEKWVDLLEDRVDKLACSLWHSN